MVGAAATEESGLCTEPPCAGLAAFWRGYYWVVARPAGHQVDLLAGDDSSGVRSAPEPHHAACARMGLVSTATTVQLEGAVPGGGDVRPLWNASALAAIAHGLGAGVLGVDANTTSTTGVNATDSVGGVVGCCVRSMWCDAPINATAANATYINHTIGYVAPVTGGACFTHGFGGSIYVNHGWYLQSSARPVYTCTNSTSGMGSQHHHTLHVVW